MLKKTTILLLSSLSLISFSLNAQPINHYVIVAPHCLLKSISSPYQTISTNQQFSLIKLDENGLNQIISAKDKQTKLCGGFFNVTDEWNTSSHQDATSFLNHFLPQKKVTHTAGNYAINYPAQVNQLLAIFNPQNLWTNLTTFSGFHDRYSKADSGADAANWLKGQVEQIAKENNRSDVTAYLVKTGTTYKQPSVVVKIGSSNDLGIVIGAHMDTLSGAFGPMPGADDDGTGSVTVLELARVLLSSNIHFQKPIYLIWYAAEEMGLVGSQYVVADFKKQNIPVEAVLHFDMTGYANKNDPTMWLVSDNTNDALTKYLETLINEYVKKPVKYTTCGYACSDHATWNKNGYPAAIAFEAKMHEYDPYIHSAQDTMSVLSLNHMTDFAKLAVAYTVEMAKPVG